MHQTDSTTASSTFNSYQNSGANQQGKVKTLTDQWTVCNAGRGAQRHLYGSCVKNSDYFLVYRNEVLTLGFINLLKKATDQDVNITNFPHISYFATHPGSQGVGAALIEEAVDISANQEGKNGNLEVYALTESIPQLMSPLAS